MISTTVIISDFVTNRRTKAVINDTYFDIVRGAWEKEDRLLAEMQENHFFEGRTRWCDLNPTHFRMLIAQNLIMVAALNDSDYTNERNPVVISLYVLLAGLVYCLQTRSECFIELLRLSRIAETEITYDMTSSLNTAVDFQKPKSGLRIIVDNET